MAECIEDAGRLEAALSAIMRGIHGSLAENPFSHLPLAQLRLLRSLNAGPQTPSALSELLSTTVSAVTQLGNRLQAAKLVEREDDPADRRVRRLKLSPLGARLMSERKELRLSRVKRLLAQLTDEERCSVVEAVERLAVSAKSTAGGADSLAFVAEIEGEMGKASEAKC